MANTDCTPKDIKAVLKQIFGEKLNETYDLTGSQVLIGRNPVCQIKLSSPSVSRKHCILTYSDDGWRVKDNKSQNGTYVNGRKLPPNQDLLLQCGDILFLGPPSEMPQAFSYDEIFEEEDEDIEMDESIMELPVKRTCEQNTEFIPKKIAKSNFQSSESESVKKPAEYSSGFASVEHHQKDLNEILNEDDRFKRSLEMDQIPVDICISSAYGDPDTDSKSLASTAKGTDGYGQIYELSNSGSDQAENSESLLNVGKDSEIDPSLLSFPEEQGESEKAETCTKSEGKHTVKVEELESKLAVLSEQIKMLKASELNLLKNYKDVCEKNRTLDQRLADKEKKAKEELQKCEVKAKNEVKSELLEKFEEDLVCNICTELFIKPSVLDCSHTFCEFCIKEWRKKKNDCPICRCTIKNVTRVRTLEEFIDKTLATLTPEQRVKRDSVIAERFIAEQPPAQSPYRSPRRRRGARSRRHRTVRHNIVSPVSPAEIQIINETSAPRPQSHARGRNLPNIPRDELNLQLNVPVVPVLRFFFSR